tara:strand:- start:187 stop:435 length:249 start_codon:yes stop_codon:yes gene_type:complete
MEKYTLSDHAIGHVAQLLQLAILTGTDIIDHLRMAELTVNEQTGKLDVHPDYAENFAQNINRMVEELASQDQAESGESTDEG